MIKLLHKQLNFLISLAILVFFIQDVIDDFMSTQTLDAHFYFELFFVIALIYLVTAHIRKIYFIKSELVKTNDELFLLKNGLSMAIKNQLNTWKLTKAETEVAWLVIKGLSFSKIAELRGVSEKTVHQQISSVYKKSKSKNRHEFVSGFLEEFINY